MEEVSLNQALAILKNRIRALEVNHLIGSRNIANQELEEICESIDKFVIPTFEKVFEENEKLEKKYDDEKFIILVLEEEKEELKKQLNALNVRNAIDKALDLIKQKRDNAQNDFKNLKCEKENVDMHIALKNQIDTYTDCIATIEAEMGRK